MNRFQSHNNISCPRSFQITIERFRVILAPKVFNLTIASPVAISSTGDVTLLTFAIVAVAVGALNPNVKH